MIEFKNVEKSFHHVGNTNQILKGISFTIQKGEFVGIIGKSGSGKSTLLNMITGIDDPTSGEVFVEGINIHELSKNQRTRWRGKNIGIVFQFFQLIPNLSLIENVLLPMDFCRSFPIRERYERAMGLLERTGMAFHADKLPSEISGGEQQRVAIARALANDPPIIVADEPTGSLDSHTAEKIKGLFQEVSEEGKTIIIVTHDPEFVTRVNRSILIVDGEIEKDEDSMGGNQ